MGRRQGGKGNLVAKKRNKEIRGQAGECSVKLDERSIVRGQTMTGAAEWVSQFIFE